MPKASFKVSVTVVQMAASGLQQQGSEGTPVTAAFMSFREQFPFGLKGRTWKGTSKNMKLAAALTCLQFTFAVYATFLLYFMSPTVDLMTGPDISWASQIAKQWRELVVVPHRLPNPSQEVSTLNSLPMHSLVSNSTPERQRPNVKHVPARDDKNLTRELVCEYEDIDFTQKRSNDSKTVDMKKALFQSILDFQMRSRGPGGAETLEELLALPSTTNTTIGSRKRSPAKVRVPFDVCFN